MCQVGRYVGTLGPFLSISLYGNSSTCRVSEETRPQGAGCVSYVSCIGRRILYYQHYLGSPLAPLTLLTSLMPSTNPA